MELYRRYIDDIMVPLHPIRNGWKCDKLKNKMIYVPNNLDNLDDQSRMMNILHEIADYIEKEIQFTTDHPSKH